MSKEQGTPHALRENPVKGAMGFKPGMVAALAVAVAVAAFPLYASIFTPYIWKLGTEERGGWRGGRETTEELTVVKGIVRSVDAENGVIVVDGKRVIVRGEWRLVEAGGVHEVTWEELLEAIRVGEHVTIECHYSGRWGLMADRIIASGFEAERVEG